LSANPKEALGIKKAPTRFTPPALAIAVGEVMATGAAKYGPLNWRENAVEAMTYVEAMERHLMAWRDGQDNAEDSGLNHLAHIAASCGILLDAAECGKLVDNRIPGPAADMLRARDRTAQSV
jgi:hypothetical protein